MAISTWPIKRLKVLVKGQKGGGKGGGRRITNAEIEDILDRMSDDHEPGNEAGKNAEVDDSAKDDAGKAGGDIDENGKKIDDQIAEGADKGQQEGAEKGQPEGPPRNGPAQNSKEGSREKGGGNNKVDYSQIKPKFNWKHIVQRFIASSLPKPEETYAKPSRKSVTGMHVAAQVGAAAIKPGEKMGEVIDLKLAICMDCSGSMLGSIAQMYGEANKLLKDPRFAKSEVYVLKFSDRHEIYKCIFARNKAHKITSVTDKSVGKYEITAQQVFATAQGGGTEISAASAADTAILLGRGYNCLLLTDTDILWGHNIKLVLDLIKRFPNQMFVVMRDRNCYIEWRKQTGIATPNISHF